MRVPVVQKFVYQRFESSLPCKPWINFYGAVVPAQTVGLVPAKFAFDYLRQFGLAHLARR